MSNAKKCQLIIQKQGKNRYIIQTYEKAKVTSRQYFNDITNAELTRITLESKGYKSLDTIRQAN